MASPPARFLFITLCALLPISKHSPALAQDLTFQDRLNAQRAIERVYYSHQIGATAPFEQAVPDSELEKKVRTYLKQSVALEQLWHETVTSEALHAEAVRMAQDSRLPDRLGELYVALNHDSVLVQECLARPALVQRLVHSFFLADSTIHAGPRAEAEALRQQLLDREIDPLSEHPRRHLIETGPASTIQANPSDLRLRTPALSDPGFGTESTGEFRLDVPREIGEVSPVIEESGSFVIRVPVARISGGMRIAVYTVPKVSYDSWWQAIQGGLDDSGVTTVASASNGLPTLGAVSGAQGSVSASASSPRCLPTDAWNTTLMYSLPVPRYQHLAVWTGSEMIVWGGFDSTGTWTRTGARYNPATDTWRPMSTVGAPGPLGNRTAHWTGNLVLIVGNSCNSAGGCFIPQLTGVRYDPLSDSWSTISATGAPPLWIGTSASWVGTRLMVWGGQSLSFQQFFNTGALYDPAADTWTPTSTVNAPSPRTGVIIHGSGSTVIVWGGGNASIPFRDGSRYDPISNTWTFMPSLATIFTGPFPESERMSVWTGTQMLLWMGTRGFRFDSVTNNWSSMSGTGAPQLLEGYRIVWTGTDMILWGGRQNVTTSYENKGYRYNLANNTWTPISSVNGPRVALVFFSAIWTGQHMIIWGGYYQDSGMPDHGSRYDPGTDSWTPTSANSAPKPRYQHEAVWTGTEMVVLGGRGNYFPLDAGRYDPALDLWRPVSLDRAPEGMETPRAVWTGKEVILWGDDRVPDTRGRYDPRSDTWLPMSNVDAPFARYSSAVWTGRYLIVLGGLGEDLDPHGRRYDPSTDTWSPISSENAPSPRWGHMAAWTGHEMLIWGGLDLDFIPLGDGGRYDPDTDTWGPMSIAGAPSARGFALAVWTGSVMVVWGGQDNFPRATGGVYDPATDTWRATSMVNAPTARFDAKAAWARNEMIVWGGFANGAGYLKSGARYDPAFDRWEPTSTANAPAGRTGHSTVWADRILLIFGGTGQAASPLNDSGGGYSLGCQPPIIGPLEDIQAECSAPGGAVVTLDGSSVRDPDSTPGTTDDIQSYEWLKDYGLETQETLGNDAVVTASLPLGTSQVTLWVTDFEGGASFGSLAVTVTDTSPPNLSCPATAVAECISPTGAFVGLEAAATDSCSPSILVENDRTSGGADASGEYPLGNSSVRFSVTDSSGNIATCASEIRVQDTVPPALEVTPSSSILWPPNHRLVDLNALVTAIDACSSPSVVLSSIESSEPDDGAGPGDGNTAGDIQMADQGTADFDFQLRAERDGSASGRTYAITYIAVDTSGNSSVAQTTVTVPHDVGGIIEPLILSAQEDAQGTLLSWGSVAGASAYSVIRGNLRGLRLSTDFIDLGAVACIQAGAPETSTRAHEDEQIPAVGEAVFYLAAYDDGRKSGYGSASASKPRVVGTGGCEWQ